MRLLALLLLLACGQAWGELLCVKPTGGNCGTSGATTEFTGLSSVQYATTDTSGKVDADDTLYICGTFTGETLTLTSAGGEGSIGHPITISFACPGNPGSINLNGAVDYGVLLGAGTDYISIVGVPGAWTFTGASTTVSGNQGSFASLDGTGIVLTDVSVSGNTADRGFRLRKCQSCNITRPVITGSLSHGIYISGDGSRNATDITISSPVIYSNGYQAISMQGSSATTDVQRVTIKDPLIYGNGDGPYPKFTKDVRIFGTTPTGCRIYSNTNTTNGLAEGYGIGIQQSDDAWVFNCEIYGNRSDGIEIWGNSTVGSSRARIFGNFIHDHTNTIADGSQGNGVECRTGYSTCIILSNILVDNQRNARIGPSASGTSYLINNTMRGGVDSIRGVVGNAPGYAAAALTGWEIKNNVLADPSGYWLKTDVASGNSNSFATNDFYGEGAAIYENVTYTGTSIVAVDSTRLDDIRPSWAGGAAPANASGYCLSSTSTLLAAGTYIGAYATGYGGEDLGKPPVIGARGQCHSRASASTRPSASRTLH